MFHESTRESFRIEINRGHSDEDINRYMDLNNVIQLEMKEKSPNKIIAKVVSLCYEKDPKCPRPSEYHLMSYILDVCRDQGDWYPNRFQMDRYVMKIQTLLAGDEPRTWEEQVDTWIREYY